MADLRTSVSEKSSFISFFDAAYRMIAVILRKQAALRMKRCHFNATLSFHTRKVIAMTQRRGGRVIIFLYRPHNVTVWDRKSRMVTSRANPLRSLAWSDKRATVHKHTHVHSDRSHKGLHAVPPTDNNYGRGWSGLPLDIYSICGERLHRRAQPPTDISGTIRLWHFPPTFIARTFVQTENWVLKLNRHVLSSQFLTFGWLEVNYL